MKDGHIDKTGHCKWTLAFYRNKLPYVHVVGLQLSEVDFLLQFSLLLY